MGKPYTCSHNESKFQTRKQNRFKLGNDIHRKPKYLVNVITELKIIKKKFSVFKNYFLYLVIIKNLKQ